MTLIDRLSKLEGPDREADAEIDVLFFGGETVWKQANYTMEQFPASKRASKHHICGYAYEHVPAYTASVDAAIALARRLWPDVMYRVGNHAEGYDPSLYLGEILIPGETQRDYFTGVASSDAIALCIALLRAKEASNVL